MVSPSMTHNLCICLTSYTLMNAEADLQTMRTIESSEQEQYELGMQQFHKAKMAEERIA